MEISGRSKDHLIDRITLSNNASDPLNLDNIETPCDDSLDINNVTTKPSIKLFPNPASSELFLNVVNKINSSTVSIFDYKGAKVQSIKVDRKLNKIDISLLSSGIYFLITNKGQKFRFIKK